MKKSVKIPWSMQNTLGTFLTLFRTNRIFATLFGLYVILSILLFLYSFTQMDLNLTLLNHAWALALQKPFLYLGYYQRMLSTQIYIALLVGQYTLYLATLFFITKKVITKSMFWFIVTGVTLCLVFSYNAFSHDIFNYMFDARIFTYHHKSPYQFKAQDFPEDNWTRFMHWTHRTYPYGPVWLTVTVPLTFIGAGIFLPTFFLFKLLAAAGYLGITYFLYKILEKRSPQHALLGAAFFALNPMSIIELLVSAHNEAIMIFFAVFAIYLLLIRKRIFAIILFLLSVGVKYITAFLAPFFIIGFYSFPAAFLAVATFIYITAFRIGVQPWYFLWILPFAALLYPNRFVRVMTIGFTAGMLARYIPFLYTGSWYDSALIFEYWTTVIAIVGSLLIFLCWLFGERILSTTGKRSK